MSLRCAASAAVYGLCGVLSLGAWIGCVSPGESARFCFEEEGYCVEPDGTQVLLDGSPRPTGGAVGSDGSDGSAGGDGDGGSGGDSDTGVVVCEQTPTATDTDGDLIPDALEPEGNVGTLDSDGDGINDGCEDRNRNGVVDATETNPSSAHSDSDSLPDGVEDANHNGRRDVGETSPLRADTDGDGINDDVEDQNGNGQVDAWVDADGDGCFDAGETPGETDPTRQDTDRDGLPDNLEDHGGQGLSAPLTCPGATPGEQASSCSFATAPDGNYNPELGETIAWHADTDCDGLADGLEDRNRNGRFDSDETDPRATDTDLDGLADGVEDADRDGAWDNGIETNPLLTDTDGDGISDGAEDVNKNGVVDAFVDTDGDGCWDADETPGESDPRRMDTDGDNISDGLEDRNRDGTCHTDTLRDPLSPTNMVRTFVESCAFVADTDCDGLADGVEDVTRNGVRDLGETDAKRVDTDGDGLHDGCRSGETSATCEDLNNNGTRDEGETDPLVADSDGDDLPDGCERTFDAGGSGSGVLDPLDEDTDDDGKVDGEEDANRNCAVDEGETDPRVADPPPATGTAEFSEFSVCASQNLKRLTFAESSRPTHDYRLAFEVERVASGSCPMGTDAECDTTFGETCVDFACVAQGSYLVTAFGTDDGDGLFVATDTDDTLLGHTFQSPLGVAVDADTKLRLHRQVYGFLVINQDTGTLDELLFNLRERLASTYAPPAGSESDPAITEVGTLPARAAHDNLAAFEVNFAQRQLRLDLSKVDSGLGFGSALTPVEIRNQILLNQFLDNTPPSPSEAVPSADPIFGTADCPGNTDRCYGKFSIYVAGVQRPDQTGANGNKGVNIFVVALTPDDSIASAPSNPQNTFFAERLIRLQDLTGGSALARFAAETTKACDNKPRTKALADVLWVVDDSRSMQQQIKGLQTAARDAQAVFTSNANIIDFRLAMTTTNPARGARTLCPDTCSDSCSGAMCAAGTCADTHLGCLKVCPSGCSTTDCSDMACTSGDNVCDGSCIPSATTNASAFQAAIDADAAGTYPLPGGGGTFYYEDSLYLDCDSSSDTGSPAFINSCAGEAGSGGAFEPFFGASAARLQLTDHAGFLPSSETACTTAAMELHAKTSNTTSVCSSSSDSSCCPRLTAACGDGPTVLASQMCDLIRAMGGLPEPNQVGGLTSGARPHSSPEHGSRSARRLIETMLPALPQNYTGGLDTKTRLRRTCSESPTCQPCDPRTDNSCELVPLATIMLSDEEDFWFKDDCKADPSGSSGADKTQLPELCRYVDGDSSTLESCDVPSPTNAAVAYCDSINGLQTGTPTGYNPDSHAYTTSAGASQDWRDSGATECSPLAANASTSCVGDPCPQLSEAQCNGGSAEYNFCIFVGSGPSGECRHKCTANLSQSTCEAAATADGCAWRPGLKTTTSEAACVFDRYLNDCQACKRLKRVKEAVAGETGLAGFSSVGPVYAITRDPGKEGFGGLLGADNQPSSQDECRGGPISWGRGDGAAYRDIARRTLGRTQNVCAGVTPTATAGVSNPPSYRDFIELVIADMAVLSKPYELTGAPISATIKVGISRPTGDTFSFVEIPRSRKQGFIYDSTTNSIGFKSDPIDGQCGEGGSCPVATVIEESEIAYAKTAPHVPRENDTIYISYRLWRPVPCSESCGDGQSCVRVLCIDEGGSLSCQGGTSAECPPGYRCTNNSCVLDCTPGQLVDACIDTPNCPLCESYNPDLGACEALSPCVCNADNTKVPCNPAAARSCAVGETCSVSTCVCEPFCPDASQACATNCGGITDAETCRNAGDCDWDSVGMTCNCSSCGQARECCLRCDGLTTQINCDADSDCTWDSGTNTCSRTVPCCNPQEEVACFADLEVNETVLFCDSTCTCNPTCGDNQYCCVECGCVCLDNPN